MILVDDRIGSHDLIGHLRHWQVPSATCRLPYGDAMLVGNGPMGEEMIGVEIKAVKDALNCMRDGRFAGHQLPGLVKEYSRIWLVIEGRYGVQHSTGLLTMRYTKGSSVIVLGTQKFMYRDLSNWMTSMEVCAGVHCRCTSSRIETAQLISNLHSWWAKDWTDHKSHLAMQSALHQVDRGQFQKPSLRRRIAAELPGIGWGKSQLISTYFPTVLAMVLASEKEWAEVEGVGKTLAKRIYDGFRQS